MSDMIRNLTEYARAGRGPIPLVPISAISAARWLQSSRRLGLYIVREIANAHSGKVSVTSSAEQGTTFVLRLPRQS
jgi:hypothetical protein